MPRAAASSGKSTLRHALTAWLCGMDRAFAGQLGRGPFARFVTPIEQGSKASHRPPKRTCRHTKTAWHCGAERTSEGRLVVAPSPPELPGNEGEQAAADASLSRAPPPAMATVGSADMI